MTKKEFKKQIDYPSLRNLIEATRTLSSEIYLDRLLEKMMSLVMEHAGAIRGFFLQLDNDQLLIQARGSLRSGIRVLQGKTIGKSTRLSKEIVEYVLQNKVTVVINDAKSDSQFRDTHYLQKHNIKSILCLPLFTKGNLAGIIYLENNHKKKAFTSDRLSSLEILTSQLNISLENALLYQNLEEKVKERTREITQQKREVERTHKELKITQTQLVQSEKMASLGQLTAGIAHEINNPVNFITIGIMGLEKNFDVYKKVMSVYESITTNDDIEAILLQVQEIKKEYEFDEVKAYVEQLMADIKLGAEKTAEIVKGLRNFSRIDEAVQKNAFIHECLESTLTIINNKLGDIELVKCYDQESEAILCYPGQLNQVFLNIINNAIDAIKMNSDKNAIRRITISTKHRANDVTISIKDSGIGMNSTTKKKIFDPFFTTKDVGKGTGLGLSISYGIIEKHQGIMDVISKPGSGTEFIITIPKKLKEDDEA